MKKEYLCFIEWEDACIYGSHTQSFSDDYPLMRIKSGGILVSEDEIKITLAQDYNQDYGDGRNIASYPKTCIKKIKKFNI